jgi:hypothetical protein
MGKVITHTIQGTGWWKAKACLALLALATATVIMPKGAEASVAALNAWPATPQVVSNTATGTVTGTVTVGAGTNRVMLVVVGAEYSATPATMPLTVTFGGRPVTELQNNSGGPNAIWLGFINEAGLASAAGSTLSVTNGNTTNLVAMYASAAVYSGVNQTTPISGNNSVSSGATAVTALSMPAFNIKGASGNTALGFYISNRNLQTSTPDAAYTENVEYVGTNFYLAFNTITTAPATLISSAPAVTTATASLGSAVGVGLVPAGVTTVGTIGSCSRCHGYSPADGTNRNVPAGQFQGSHNKHSGGAAGQYVFACTRCHVSNTDFDHANRTIDMANPLNGNAGAVYTKGTSFPISNAAFGGGSCTNSYCHSNGTGGTQQSGDTRGIVANSSLTWGTVGGNNYAANCSTTCHNGRPSYANYTGLTVVTGQKANSHQATTHSQQTCDVCHTSVSTTDAGVTYTTYTSHNSGRYNLKASLSYTYAVRGGTCANPGCHGSAQWGVTVMNCVSCHSSAVNITHGPLNGLTRRPIQPEFTQTWSHKASGGRTVVPADCIVCHMEGDKATGKTSTLHADGFINLRDADTGAEITNVTFSGTPGTFSPAAGNASFSRFSRDLGVPFESDPNFPTLAAIEVNHCLKCHDTDGAINANAQVPTTGSQYRPFGYAVGSTSTYYLNNIAAGNGTSNVVDVKSSFSTANASYHPVLGKQNNGFTNPAMMKAPWNGALSPAKPGSGSTTVYGFLISCWDCHANTTDAWGNGTVQQSTVIAHGNSTILRTPDAYTAASSTVNNLCTLCHGGTSNYYATGTSGHGGNSAAAATDGNIGSRHQTCANCHSSFNNSRPWRGVDAHGFNAMAQLRTDTTTPASNATWASSGAKPWAFIRTANLGNWRPARGAGLTDATNGTCGIASPAGSCNNSHGNYTPGGYY